MIDDWSFKAFCLISAGRHSDAADLLAHEIVERPSNHAWFLLSGAVSDVAEQRYCLHQVVENDPGHLQARSGLAYLGDGPMRRPAVVSELLSDELEPVADAGYEYIAALALALEPQEQLRLLALLSSSLLTATVQKSRNTAITAHNTKLYR